MTKLQTPCAAVDWNPDVQLEVPADMAPIMMAYHSPSDAADRLVASLTKLRAESDFEVCAFGAIYNDKQIAVALAEALGCPLLESHTSSGEDVINWIESLDCLIASRLHACILALVVGTPVVVIDPYFDADSGTSKIHELMKSIDFLSTYITFEDFVQTTGSLDKMVYHAIENGDRLCAVHEEMSRAASVHFDVIANIIRRQSTLVQARKNEYE
jgi:polysaccharide pyruvyl transferase WcaK-like protein